MTIEKIDRAFKKEHSLIQLPKQGHRIMGRPLESGSADVALSNRSDMNGVWACHRTRLLGGATAGSLNSHMEIADSAR